MNFEMSANICEKLLDLQKSGVIEKAISPYYHQSIMAIAKRDNYIRIVQHYKKLNEHLLLPRYPIRLKS